MTGKRYKSLLFVLIFFNTGLSHAIQQTPAGIVTLVIGKNQAINSQGKTRILKRQNTVFVGDTIETAQGSHLHIKFIDDARISIRPNSRLYIESYRYDPQIPKNNAIRFFLEQGILRSISGKATEAAHDRYRMNTPVAALGVLGTDFVIRTNSQKTLAAVYRGSIALSPITHGCSATGFGACNSAKILTADMKNLYLEVRQGEQKTQLKSQSKTGVIIDNGKVKTEKIHHKAQTTTGRVSISDPVNSIPNTDLASKARLGTAPVTPEAEIQPEKFVSAFTWARWTAPKQANDELSQSRDALEKNRKITVGNSYVGLFKDPGNDNDHIPQTGVYNFQIRQNHVVFIRPGQTWINAETATLNKSALQIDFAKRQVSTHLEMSAPGVQATQMNITGNINNNGIFIGADGHDKISGALSTTGKQAGMIFEKPLANGRFNGISTWQRQ